MTMVFYKDNHSWRIKWLGVPILRKIIDIYSSIIECRAVRDGACVA